MNKRAPTFHYIRWGKAGSMPLRRYFPFKIIMLWLTFSSAAVAHNVFTTFTTIEWNSGGKSIEMVMQTHAHELEALLSLNIGKRLTFLDDGDYALLEEAVKPAVDKMVALEVDGQLVDITYLGMELQGQTVFLYMEAKWLTAPKKITFMNAMFLDELPGQNNSVMATVGGIRRAGEIVANSGPVTMEF